MINKIIVSFFLIISINYNTFSNNFKKYENIFIKTIPIGKEKDNIGFYAKAKGGMSFGPRTFTISKNNEIIIPDFINNRINIYTLEINYIKTILEKEDKIIDNSRNIYIDNNNNIYGLTTAYGLKKIDKDGNTCFLLTHQNLPESIKYYNNFFIFNECILYYNCNNIKSINQDGDETSSQQTQIFLEYINKIWKE